MHRKVYEPVQRKKGNTYPEWISHRFEIKGGISLLQTWHTDLRKPNPLMKLVRIKEPT